MKQALIELSRRYVTALRQHLKRGPRADLAAAVGLGRRAIALGLETLALARIHERALASLKLSPTENRRNRRAENFFNAALLPMVAPHRAARPGKTALHRANATLDRRTAELAATQRQLQRGVSLRKGKEAAAAKNGRHYRKSLAESLRLQVRQRRLTRRVLVDQEDERKKISAELQNEIAQTLLGINVRLNSLKREFRQHRKGFKNEIASTQRLVVKSAKSICRFARELNPHQPA